MKTFQHFDVGSLEEASAILAEYKTRARLNAGGTDFLSLLKGNILPHYPEVIVNLKTIPDLDYIREDGEFLRIGALARLERLSSSSLLKDKYRVLAEAALSVASPQIRNMATLGGNLCQEVRCWYYRYPSGIGGPIPCLRKGEGICHAVKGDNRYHAIMGGKKCFAVCPSDTAVALAALDARIIISGTKGERSVEVAEFYHPMGIDLGEDEVVREIIMPIRAESGKHAFCKFTLRKPIDFAVASVASILTLERDLCVSARLMLGAAAPGPVHAKEAEKVLVGAPITEAIAVEAAEAALAGAKPLSRNAYKLEILRTLVKRAILGANPSSDKNC